MRNPLYGLIGLGFGVAGCLIFVALVMLADHVYWLNPQAVVILVLVMGFFAFVLGICSIKTIPGILSTSLGFLMLAFFLVLFPAWTTVSQTDSRQINKVQNSDDLQY
jgi:energy-coupling factor transporter transmembrane protein EcfT